MQLVAVGKYASHHRVDFVVQRGIVAGTAHVDAISRPGELEIIDRGIADGRRDFGHRHFARLVPGVGKCGVVTVSPQPSGLICMQEVNPGVLRKAEHQTGLLRDVPVAADILFAPIARNVDLVYPVLPLGIWSGEIRQRDGREIRLACRAEAAGRYLIVPQTGHRINEKITGRRIFWKTSARRELARGGGEIARKLRRRGYAVVMNSATALSIPFL